MTANETDQRSDTPDTAGPSTSLPRPRRSALFSVPEPIRRVFDKFPLVTYPANQLPGSLSHREGQNVLYIFITESGAKEQRPSFNPTCLKWQLYLKIAGVKFTAKASNNHASPSGALPFLLPSTSQSSARQPIAANKLHKWTKEQAQLPEEPNNMRYEAYLSLLDFRIRHAWLYSLYLVDINFNSVARRLYIEPSTSNALVQVTLGHQLQNAAREEIQKSSRVIDVSELMADADQALEALSHLLGEQHYFFGASKPSLFDASVFSYTHLLLDDDFGWKDEQLVRLVKKRENLVNHRDRLLFEYF